MRCRVARLRHLEKDSSLLYELACGCGCVGGGGHWGGGGRGIEIPPLEVRNGTRARPCGRCREVIRLDQIEPELLLYHVGVAVCWDLEEGGSGIEAYMSIYGNMGGRVVVQGGP